VSEKAGSDSSASHGVDDGVQQEAVRAAQERTLGLYHQLMKINAASHLIRTLRQLGVVDALREKQCTLEQLCEDRKLHADVLSEILDAAVAIGIVEQYQDDYALSRAAHLLCQYDHDLADEHWQKLAGLASGEITRQAIDDRLHNDHLAATQWTHTPAAMEAAEVLDFGGDSSGQVAEILDLGCGSAVWTCAMAYRDPNTKVTAVDHPAALEAASNTAASIGLGDRFQTISGDPLNLQLVESAYDWVVIAQRLSGLGGGIESEKFLNKAARYLKPGGRLVVIDLVEIGGKPTLADRVDSLRLKLATRHGEVFTPEQLQKLMASAGLCECQFALLSKGHSKMGVAVARRAEESN